MKASDKNKGTYEFLMECGNDFIEQEVLEEMAKGIKLFSKETNHDFKDKDTVKHTEAYIKFLRIETLDAAGLIIVKPFNNDPQNRLFISITSEGWQFCDAYEKDKRSRQTNNILIFLTAIMSVYYAIEILKFLFYIKSPIFGGCHCH